MPSAVLVLSFVLLGKVGVEVRRGEVGRGEEVEGGRVRGVDVEEGVVAI